MLVSKPTDSLRVLYRYLTRDRSRAQRLGQLEAIIQLVVLPGVDGIEFHDLDVDAGVSVLLPEFFGLLHGGRDAPLPQFGERALALWSLTAAAAARGFYEFSGHAHERLDGLRPQLDGTHAQRETALECLVAGHGVVAEAVRHIQANLHS